MPRRFQYGLQGFQRTPYERLLIEQIRAGIPRQAQFRQYEDFRSGFIGLAHERERLFGVIVAVGGT